jgi:hypothetical protein
MATMRLTHGVAALLLVIAAVSGYAEPEGAKLSAQTEVHIAVFRLDYQTFGLKTAYEFAQPYRKSLPKPGYEHLENLYVYTRPAGDFGFTLADCRLTGKQVLNAETVWMGRGRFLYPTANEHIADVQYGFTSPDPVALVEISTTTPVEVWDTIRGTDVIHRLASHGAYEVYIKRHFYTVGVHDPTTAEWIIIAFTHPPAPLDVGLVDVLWPRTLITAELPVTPEIKFHNFSDAPTDVGVRVTLNAGGSAFYSSERTITSISADESRVVSFDDFARDTDEPMEMRVALVNPDGGTWDDEFADNDESARFIGVTRQPVFRRAARIPAGGVPLDFDGDGATDIVGLTQYLSLLLNDGAGRFTDVTENSQIDSRLHPRNALAGDFTGDGVLDLVVAYWEKPVQFLRGVSPGVFVEFSDESGLSSITGLAWIEAVDIDGDGDLDLLSAAEGQVVLENDGSGHFINVTAASGITMGAYRIAVGDISGDEVPDLVLGSWGGRPGVYHNNGDGYFTSVAGPWQAAYSRGPFLLDVERDGDLDLFLLQSKPYDPSVLYRNNGNLEFEDISLEVGQLPVGFTAAVGDFNDDGYPDVISSSGTLYMNNGGQFADMTELLVDVSPAYNSFGAVYFVDLNADGFVDVYSENGAFISRGVLPPDDPPPPPTPVENMAACLDQNVPNPFNPTTNIHYVIERRTHASLRIYNVVGQLVRTVVDRMQTPRLDGYTASWDGTDEKGNNVASGVYFYELRTNHFTQTRKMVLVR